MTESLCSTMNVRSPKPLDTKHGVTRYFRFTVSMFFVLDFFISLMCVWLEKLLVLVICIHKRVKSIVFTMSIKFCHKSGWTILNVLILYFLTGHDMISLEFKRLRQVYGRLSHSPWSIRSQNANMLTAMFKASHIDQ